VLIALTPAFNSSQPFILHCLSFSTVSCLLNNFTVLLSFLQILPFGYSLELFICLLAAVAVAGVGSPLF
jgi:hypothetical protein